MRQLLDRLELVGNVKRITRDSCDKIEQANAAATTAVDYNKGYNDSNCILLDDNSAPMGISTTNLSKSQGYKYCTFSIGTKYLNSVPTLPKHEKYVPFATPVLVGKRRCTYPRSDYINCSSLTCFKKLFSQKRQIHIHVDST